MKKLLAQTNSLIAERVLKSYCRKQVPPDQRCPENNWDLNCVFKQETTQFLCLNMWKILM